MAKYKYYGGSAFPLYDFKNKQNASDNYIMQMLARTRRMFKYSGLPESIPERILELFLQTSGNIAFTKVDGDLRIFTGSLGGEPDIYYRPTKYIIGNPKLKESLNLTIDENCVVIPNDSMYMGLIPLFSKYASALVENDISMNIARINSRIASLIAAGDDRTAKTAKEYLKQVCEGDIGIVADNTFLDGIRTQPYGERGATTITDLIEDHQYIKASWLNDIGLQANYNMKRESINSNEAQLNEDALFPFVEDMLKCRQEGLEQVNKMFGTSISVDFDSSWKDNKEELQKELDNLSKERR